LTWWHLQRKGGREAGGGKEGVEGGKEGRRGGVNANTLSGITRQWC